MALFQILERYQRANFKEQNFILLCGPDGRETIFPKIFKKSDLENLDRLDLIWGIDRLKSASRQKIRKINFFKSWTVIAVERIILRRKFEVSMRGVSIFVPSVKFQSINRKEIYTLGTDLFSALKGTNVGKVFQEFRIRKLKGKLKVYKYLEDFDIISIENILIPKSLKLS